MTETDAGAIAAICHRLDGLPLAIELAAARVRVLSPQAILDRLSARLRLLTGGPRDVPSRQQTLRGAIEWSYGLLEPAERGLFARLSVFAGGRSTDAVEAICTSEGVDPVDLLDQVDSLVSQSLLQRVDGAGVETRFVMLETIHEYAREMLDAGPDAASTRRRHAEFFLALAERAEPLLSAGAQQLDWMGRLTREHDNLRSALEWSSGTDGDTQIALRLIGAMWHFWEMSGALSEGQRWSDAALVLPDAGNWPESLLRACSGAGTLAWASGDYDRAAPLHEQSLLLARSVGDKPAEAFALNALGALLTGKDDHEAETLYGQAAALALEIGEDRIAAMALHNTGEIALNRADYPRAARLYERSAAIWQALGDRWLTAGSLHGSALTRLRQGNHDAAAATLRESLHLAAQFGENNWVAESLEGLAAVAESSSRPVLGARLLGAADRLRRRIGTPKQPAELRDYARLVDALHNVLSDDAFNQAWEEGRRLTVGEAVEEATRAFDLAG